jgi:hypothetical protein
MFPFTNFADMSRTGSIRRLNRVLRQLMHVAGSKEEGVEELAAMYQKATSAVAEMKRAVARPYIIQVAELVQLGQWDKAAEVLRKKFPRCDREDAVTEVILLVCTDDDNFDMFLLIFAWVMRHQDIIRMQMWRIQELYRRTQPEGRAKLILAAFGTVSDDTTKEDMARDLHAVMTDMNQTKTFAEFCLFNAVKNIVLSSYGQSDHNLSLRHLLRQELKETINAPECAHLLLSADTENQRLRLINKKFGMPLCVDEEHRVSCCNTWDTYDNMLCVVRVDPDTALTCFSYKLDDHTWFNLDASENKVIVSVTGSQWMIKVLDKRHIKIFNNDGKSILKSTFCLL